MTTLAAASRRCRGSVLVLVLWVLALLTVIAGIVATDARVARTVATAPWQGLQAEAAARTILAVIAPLVVTSPAQDQGGGSGVVPDGRTYRLSVDGRTFTFSVRAEAAKIDLNKADEATLTALFRGLTGSDAPAKAVLDWRDRDREPRGEEGAEAPSYLGLRPSYTCPDRPFERIEELLKVRWITPELFWGIPAGEEGGAAWPLLDLVTIYGSKGVILQWAAQPVRLAVEEAGLPGEGGPSGRSSVFCLQFSLAGASYRIYWQKEGRGFKVLDWLQGPT